MQHLCKSAHSLKVGSRLTSSVCVFFFFPFSLSVFTCRCMWKEVREAEADEGEKARVEGKEEQKSSRQPWRDQIGRWAVGRVLHLLITTIWLFEGWRLQRLWVRDTATTNTIATNAGPWPSTSATWRSRMLEATHASADGKAFLIFTAISLQNVLNPLLLLLLSLRLRLPRVLFHSLHCKKEKQKRKCLDLFIFCSWFANEPWCMTAAMQ